MTSGACEFRRNDVRHVFDYDALSGASHHVYPQQMLVADLLDALRAVGREVFFRRPAAEVRATERPELRLEDGASVRCDFVLGCDGFHGVTRSAVAGASCSGVDFGAEWLALLAGAPPSSDHTVFALHPDGFAGSQAPEELIPNAVVRAEGVEPVRGPILERGTLQLHS